MSEGSFAILVELVLAEGARGDFLPLLHANAGSSVADEAGCRRFDVLDPAGEPNRILLYEIYSDRAAFDLHLASAHYLHFDAATRTMLAGKTVTILALTENAKP